MNRSSCASSDQDFRIQPEHQSFKRSVDLTLPGRKNVQWLNQFRTHSFTVLFFNVSSDEIFQVLVFHRQHMDYVNSFE